MIKILILSDDVCGWAEQIVEDLINTKSRIDTNQKSARIWNDTFVFQILAEFDPIIAERFNNIILDKYINNIEYNVYISKMLLPNGNIQKTERYKKWESSADTLLQEIRSIIRTHSMNYKNIYEQ